MQEHALKGDIFAVDNAQIDAKYGEQTLTLSVIERTSPMESQATPVIYSENSDASVKHTDIITSCSMEGEKTPAMEGDKTPAMESDKTPAMETETIKYGKRKSAEDDESEVSVCKRIELDVDNVRCFGQYPKIVCLGTGAAIPSKYRNVSATLVFLR